ncbi:hypothetical protein Ae201684P_010699 [Aphanomyces euteiches]|uniref:Peroxisomal membrane protein PEX14 n=1 Tax=Aphanomyces euteiches TaxID=100861 RepID=A0A6G0WDJ2_9STRA|nr:hypothetical protein Ae201684_016848 [Aphanomyces euteiches]KAH9076766.1 hypothetical protein Ae201684P_010699 [Aphanomyces euteiches]
MEEKAPAESATAPVDLDKINSGVRFLNHPDVQSTPLSERLAFLEKKGLSRAEINAAVEKLHQASATQTISASQSSSASPWSLLYPVLGTTAILGFLWRFLLYDSNAENEHIQKGPAPLTQEAGNTLIQTMQQQTTEISKLVQTLHQGNRERHDRNVSQDEHDRVIAELRAEISSLQQKVKDLGGNTTVVAKAEEPRLPEDKGIDFEAVAQKMLDALELVEKDNTPEVIKTAATILLMYTKNLIEHPDVPRYRRIATGNANFKQKIEPLKHYEQLLSSIGFEKAGMNMEWKWHSAPAFNSYMDILKAAVYAFECTVSNSDASKSLVENARTKLSGPKEVTPAGTEEKETLVAPNLESFLTKLKNKSESPNAEAQKNEPKYPQSFGDVIKMVQNGEEVPGIKTIEDKVSTDADKCLEEPPTSQEVKKPWQQA